MDLSKDDVFKIIKLIEESGYDDVRLEVGDFKVHVQKHGAGVTAAEPFSGQALRSPAADVARKAAAPAAAAPAVSKAAPEERLPDGAVVVRAPMLGTFYRSPSPGEKPFVEVGAKVARDDTICLVEVMKLFNSIKAGTAGTVVKILAENAAMVEHGQPLVVIAPD
jgi:acetyl-CoA carboxylase biotin carboxyl carrier protein